MYKFKFNLFILFILFSFKAYSTGLKGAYADLGFQKQPNYTSVFIKNKLNERLVCHWGIDGHQWISYLEKNGKTDNLYFDHKKYSLLQVSFRCIRDKKQNHKIGTFKIYPNKYY
tara:strand:+ start:1196 stop:1537 length:342 start_codon:yes stop_codon:yes gene_type:complete